MPKSLFPLDFDYQVDSFQASELLPRAFGLIIPLELKKAFDCLCEAQPSVEWSGYGIVHQLNNRAWILTNLVIPDKISSSAATTSIDNSTYSSCQRYVFDNSPVEKRVDLMNSLKIWIHSHHNMGVTWSSKDLETIQMHGGFEIEDESECYYLALVVNNKGNMSAAYGTNVPFPVTNYDFPVVTTTQSILNPVQNSLFNTESQLKDLEKRRQQIEEEIEAEVSQLRYQLEVERLTSLAEEEDTLTLLLEEEENQANQTLKSLDIYFTELASHLSQANKTFYPAWEGYTHSLNDWPDYWPYKVDSSSKPTKVNYSSKSPILLSDMIEDDEEEDNSSLSFPYAPSSKSSKVPFNGRSTHRGQRKATRKLY